MNILGISCYYHDAAAVLLQDGLVVAAADEERFTRIKHDSRFPSIAITFCLAQGNIESRDIDYVVFYEKPWVKFDRILMTCLGTYPSSWRVFGESMNSWLKDKLWMRRRLQAYFSLPRERFLFVDHHISHAASAFFSSPFRDAAIVTLDGVGEWTTAAVGYGTADWDGTTQNKIELYQQIKFPHSIGLLYSAFTSYLGFRVNNGEYKVMGMAPYGESRYLDEIAKVVDVSKDGSIHLNMDYFSFTNSTDQSYNERFVSLFGPPRKPESEFFTTVTHPDRDGDAARENQRYADIAASIQKTTEEIILRMVKYAKDVTGSSRLVMAGGVALNGVANGRILREVGFEDMFIQPAAGDPGGALGAALYAYHVLLGKPRRYVMEDVYLGQGYSCDEIQEVLDETGIPYEKLNSDEQVVEQVVTSLVQGHVVGWFRGRFEWGPRALGNRSILADPRREDMKEIVNTKIKFREPFRPFAPVILEEATKDYFDLNDPERNYPARFMQLVVPIFKKKQSLIPAVNHMGTGRLQTIRRETNSAYYDVVSGFGQATGVPVVMNTSFNLRGEPIVNSPREALNTFLRSGIDLLVMENFLVRGR